MNNTNMILSHLMEEVCLCRSALNDAEDAANGAAFREILNLMQQELSRMEAQIRTLASVRGLEFDGLPPISHYLTLGRLRIRLHFHNTDSKIAESMICFFTKTLIRILKTGNCRENPEPHTELIYQRYLGCLTAAIRSLQEYL